jgi:small neutral amino acid transporter SnatA (MarC family)
LAGPGAISAAIVLAARAQGEAHGLMMVMGAVIAVMAVSALFMMAAQ